MQSIYKRTVTWDAGDFRMNAKHSMAVGVAAALLGFGPTIASAEGFYLSAFGGLSTIDLDQNAFDASYGPILQDRVGFILDDGTDEHEFRGTASGYVPGSIDDSGIGWGLQIGYEFNPYVALEIGYVDLGKARQEGGSIVGTFASETTAFTFNSTMGVSARVVSAGPTIAVQGKFPFGPGFSVHGKGGIYFADTRVRMKYIGVIDELSPDLPFEAPVEFKAGTQELFAGIGGGWDFSEDFGMRIEYQYFLDVGDEDRTGEADAQLLSFGIVFR